MVSRAPGHRSVRQRLRPYEIAFLILGLGALIVLLLAGSHQRFCVGSEVFCGTAIYFGAVGFLSRKQSLARERGRLGLNYLFAAWFYGATSRITAALAAMPRDRPLLASDEFLFGRTPAVFLESWIQPWLTDVLSLCYLSYHIYIFSVVLWAMGQSERAIQRLSVPLFSGFAVGFLGYLLVPALGPGTAYPNLFSRDLGGGFLTHINDLVVAMGSAPYGNFPSLHLLLMVLLLEHDWHACRARFWAMIAPAVGMLVATVYLRYHYAVDLLAGIVLFPLVRSFTRDAIAPGDPAISPR